MGARRLVAVVDRPLAIVVGILCLLGLYNLSSAGRTLGVAVHTVQAGHMLVGFLLLLLVASVHYRNFEGLAIPIFVGVLLLLVATQVFGVTVNGSRRWLPLPGFRLQTSDVAKLAVILIVARLLHLQSPTSAGLTLNQIFRPFNVSRPLALVVAVIVLSVAGERISPPKLQRVVHQRSRTVLTLDRDIEKVVIGSSKASDVQLAHRDVAASHSVVRRTTNGWSLEDVDSQSRTFVNGVRLRGAHLLEPADVLRFGTGSRAEIRFSSSIGRWKPALPWIAIVAAIWLFAALFAQLNARTRGAGAIIAPIDVVALPCALILIQPDLGTTLVILAIAFSMFLYVGMNTISLALLTVFGFAGGVFSWLTLLKPYQKQRVLTFLNPTADPLGAGYHQHQSLIAVGSGQVFGKGQGQGTQTQLHFLPEQQTDFIFSVWAEEHGFVGSAIVVMLFAALIILCLRISGHAKDRFGSLLVVGVTAMIFWHTLINMLMVLRFAPVVGVPLPLWSYGGSFVVTTLIGLGIVFNVGMRRYVF